MRYSLYLPSGVRDLGGLFRRGRESEAVAELERRAALGASAAKVVLAYLCLQGQMPDKKDMDRAALLLEEPTLAGDAYALYVMGWIHFLRDKDAKRAVTCWVSGADQGFLPSIFELGRFLAWDLPGRPPRIESAIEKLRLAGRLGHKQAACIIATLDIHGARGSLYALGGRVRWLFALVRFAFWLQMDPFAQRVFSRPLNP